jgi:inorganic pyrophosphatase
VSKLVNDNESFIAQPRPEPLWKLLGTLYKAHPWHGVSPGEKAPAELLCFVEVVPSDTVKYEMDKLTGYLRLDRPQKYSNVCPALYGFVPQTLCATRVAALSSERVGADLKGDGDPLDICILSERPISHGNILVDCIPIGGLRMLDHGEADDKIVAVLKGDAAYGGYTSIADVSTATLDRLRHYFLTYKQPPDATTATSTITHVYDRAEAFDVISRSLADYDERFGALETLLTEALHFMSRDAEGDS